MKKKHDGFSVIEVLIVVVIIGVLSVAGLLIYERKNSNDRKNDSKQAALSKHVPATTINLQNSFRVYRTNFIWIN